MWFAFSFHTPLALVWVFYLAPPAPRTGQTPRSSSACGTQRARSPDLVVARGSALHRAAGGACAGRDLLGWQVFSSLQNPPWLAFLCSHLPLERRGGRGGRQRKAPLPGLLATPPSLRLARAALARPWSSRELARRERRLEPTRATSAAQPRRRPPVSPGRGRRPQRLARRLWPAFGAPRRPGQRSLRSRRPRFFISGCTPGLWQRQQRLSPCRFLADPTLCASSQPLPSPPLLPPPPAPPAAASLAPARPPAAGLRWASRRRAPSAPRSRGRDWATVPEPPVPRRFQGSSLLVKDRLRGAWKPVRGRARERRASELRD